ncbi:MAG: 2-succinyl-5-enolpyruvyl-6-hydroxy-3-cyclohexene-1-carboxylic-acid synthase, partial [Deltaproteobacteria bacterium]
MTVPVLESENLNMLWASIIVEELVRNGIDYFCISPGSRSSPLTISVAKNKKARLVMCYDERGAAFHALGFARATHRPAVVITTSGTAVANCFPAVVEASMECVPMILLTADRPPELQDTKANQTIDQSHIFGRYVRYFFNLPCPESDVSPRVPLTTVDQAVFRAVSEPKGPVHINCMFREPLSPEKKDFPKGYADCLKSWAKKSTPYTTYRLPIISISETEAKEICQIMNSAENGLVIAGSIDIGKRDSVLKLINKAKWPVFSDIRSHLPYFLSKNIVPFFPLFLSAVLPDVSFDVVLHIGGMLVSKHMMQLLEEKSPDHYIVVKEDPFRQDMNHISTMHVQTDIKKFCETVLPYLNTKKSSSFDALMKISSKIKDL